MDKNTREAFYEQTDFSALLSGKHKQVRGPAKRITLNISDRIYQEANDLDSYMKMGYQNVLKTAMTIGLTELYDHVSRHSVAPPKKRAAAPMQKSPRALARSRRPATDTAE